MADQVVEKVTCEGHGTQDEALLCVHLAEAEHGDSGLGFHWSRDEDGSLLGNCDDCEAECDDEGYFPDELVEDTFVVMCKACFIEVAHAHGIKDI